MAEVIPVPYAVEDGKNANNLINWWQSDEESVELKGRGRALGPVVAKLGFVPQYEKEIDFPGSLDDYARAVKSDPRTLLMSKNRVGVLVPKRPGDYLEDRQDALFGLFSDYFLGNALNIIGSYLAGRKENNLDEIEKFIYDVNKRHPINEASEGPAPVSPSPTSPGPGASTYYEVIRRIPVNSADPVSYKETKDSVTIDFAKKNNIGG